MFALTRFQVLLHSASRCPGMKISLVALQAEPAMKRWCQSPSHLHFLPSRTRSADPGQSLPAHMPDPVRLNSTASDGALAGSPETDGPSPRRSSVFSSGLSRAISWTRRSTAMTHARRAKDTLTSARRQPPPRHLHHGTSTTPRACVARSRSTRRSRDLPFPRERGIQNSA